MNPNETAAVHPATRTQLLPVLVGRGGNGGQDRDDNQGRNRTRPSVAREIRRHPDRFDAALVGGQMPEMDGYEATRAIRQERPDLSLPIVAVITVVPPTMGAFV